MRVLLGLLLAASACATTLGAGLDPGGAGSTLDVLEEQPAAPAAASFHTPHGSNGRHCGTCHLASSGWSIRPADIEALFVASGGSHPLFNRVDADNPARADLSTVSGRRAAFSMLRRGLFRKSVAPPEGAEFEVVAAVDPRRAASVERLVFFRRPLATANLRLATGSMWDDKWSVASAGANNLRARLVQQARAVLTTVEEGPAPAPATVEAIVEDELHMWSAVERVDGVALDGCGARGGTANLMRQPLVSGPWTLFDAWIDLAPGRCGTRRADALRARIAHGQQVFNQKKSVTGERCVGCHNVANAGSNVDGILFDIGTSSPLRRTPDMPVYRLRDRATGAVRDTTDPGKALISGRWSDVDRFKVPALRGVSLRAPYFHNGSASTLRDVLAHYEEALGFDFSDGEREDLLAFLEAL